MIFFKAIIFIFFFLVSNNIFATENLPDCSTLEQPTVENLANTPPMEGISRPGDTCNYYIDDVGVPPCSTLSGDKKPRLNCMDLEDLPSCDILEANYARWVDAGSDATIEPKTKKSLRNCLNLTSTDTDICVSGDGKTNGVNCINFCSKDNSDSPSGCKKRMYHHYTDSDVNDRLGFRNSSDLQYSCEKLTSDELVFFSDEFTFEDCRDLLEINDGTKRIARMKVEGGEVPINRITKYDEAPNKEEFITNLSSYSDSTEIAGLNCRYPLCDSDFQNLDEATNEDVQNNQDVMDSNNKFSQLKNCTNIESEAFVPPSKIVCSGNKMCYDFTVNQIPKLISSPNKVEKCLNNARDNRSVSRCFSNVEQEKMCQIHRTLGPDCKQSCKDSSGSSIPGLLLGESCFFSNCALLPKDSRNVNNVSNCSDTECSGADSDDCYTKENAVDPGINCNFYDTTKSANYDFDYSALDNTYELNLLDSAISDAYKDKFFKTTIDTPIPYSNLGYANLATNKNPASGRKFPDYLRQDICDADVAECTLDFADDCNYPSDTFKPVCISSKDPFYSPDLDVDNMNLDETNKNIAKNVADDSDNDWFYKPYPLVDRGSTNANNKQFRNIDKWTDFIDWGDNYNGSLFNFKSNEEFVTPRDDAEVKYKNTNNNDTSRGAFSNRLCYDYGHLKDLNIIDKDRLAAQMAIIIAAGVATAVAVRFACQLCPPGFEVAAGLAVMHKMKEEFNFNKFISPKQCDAVIIRLGFLKSLHSSNVSGYNGEGADEDDQNEYKFQYDEIDIDDRLTKKYKFLDDSAYHYTASHEYNYFKQEFLLGNNFNKDIKVDVEGKDTQDLLKIVLTKDAYIRGDIYTEITGHDRRHRIMACVRFGGGARSCNVDCNLIGCVSQGCGNDSCEELVVDDSTNPDSTCSIATYGDKGLVEKDDIEFGSKDCAKEVSSKDDDSKLLKFIATSGKVRVRAVAYPGRYICVFADAQHDEGGPWKVRGLIPSVSKPFKTLGGFGGDKYFTEKHCLRYGNKIDTTITSNMVDCSVGNPSYSCSPAVHYASDTKEWTDSFMNKATTPITVDDHKSAKKILFSDFKKDIFVRNTDIALNKVFKADFFNPSILVDFGSELAISSLRTGCLGGASDTGDDISSDCSEAYSSSSMLLNNDDDDNCRSYNADNNANCPRRNVKTSDDGIFKLRSNRYNDFTGTNYNKFLYIEKTISGDTPTLILRDDQNNPIEGKPILRNLPDYNNIILRYDDSEGEFIIQLKDNVDTLLPAVKLPESLEWITTSENKDSETCFDKDTDPADRAKLENMKFCLKQDECSPLLTTCIENNLINADQDQKNDLWRKCFDNDKHSLINKCSKKWNVSNPNNKSTIEDIIAKIKESRNNETSTDNKYYGWHHEVCLDSKSYNPVKVYSYAVDDAVGKCILDPVKSGNATIDTQGTDNIEDDEIVTSGIFIADSSCNYGGNEALKNTDGSTHNPCFCLRSSDSLAIKKLIAIGFTTNDIDNLPILRDATPRELGLCFDKDLPLSCQSNIIQEIDKYGNDGRYKKRTIFNEDTKHAEYDFVFLPFSQFNSGVVVQGKCNENWGLKSNSRVPSMICKEDSGVARFDDHKIEIIFNHSCVGDEDHADENCTNPNNITLSNNDSFNIFLVDLGKNKKFKDSNGARLDSISELFASGDSITLKSVNNEVISATVHYAGTNHIEVKNFDPEITSDFILKSIEYNRSENTSCSRPKCYVRSEKDQFYVTNEASDKGGRYRNPIHQERSLLDKKAHEVGYAEWKSSDGNPVSIIAEGDIDILVPASRCLDGFVKEGSEFPQKTCTPEGVVFVKSDDNDDVINACERKSCDFSETNWDDPTTVVNTYKGANFNNLDLDTDALKASRSTSDKSFDFKVTDFDERSTATGECYYDLTKGFTYVQPGDNPPQLACDHNEDIVNNMYVGRCVPANCADTEDTLSAYITSSPIYSAGEYVDTLGGIYAKSQKSCSVFQNSNNNKSYKNYPYDLESRYQDSTIRDIISSDANGNLEIIDSIISGGSTPIRNCYNSNSEEEFEDSNITIKIRNWNTVDNPCVIQCLGAKDFQENIGRYKAPIMSEQIREVESVGGDSLISAILITIEENLRNNPPKNIVYSDNKTISISQYRKYISIRYPDSSVNTAEDKTVIEIRKSINDESVFPLTFTLTNEKPTGIELVNRVNTGITKHRVSTRTDEIEIEWPSLEFGEKNYAFFDKSSTPPQNPINTAGEHYKIYSQYCDDRDDCSEDITFSDNLPSDHFKRGRVYGKFLVARKCNISGIWSEENIIVTDSNIDEYRDPNIASNKATPLCAFKGAIGNTNLTASGNNLMYENHIASSHFYLADIMSGNEAEKDRIRQDMSGNYQSLSINYPNIIDVANGYSLANRKIAGTATLIPYSIQKCKYENEEHRDKKNIDKLSLYEYEPTSDDPFSSMYDNPLAEKYCSPEGLPENIGDSTRPTANKLFFNSNISNNTVVYGTCPDNHTKSGEDPTQTCNSDGSWTRNLSSWPHFNPVNSNCKGQCQLSGTWFNHGKVARRAIESEDCDACHTTCLFGFCEQVCDPTGGTKSFMNYSTCDDGEKEDHRWNGDCRSNTLEVLNNIADITLDILGVPTSAEDMILIP